MTSSPALTDPDQLREQIAASYPGLSKRLQQVARYVVDHPNDIAMDTVAELAARAQVQPSTLIRFAKAFGYSGFSEMQRIFRRQLKASSASYGERVQRFWEQRDEPTRPQAGDVLHEFAAATRLALEHLDEGLPGTLLSRAVTTLAEARVVHVVGQRRAFPVAAYLAYALSHGERPAHLLDGAGGMLQEQLRLLSGGDVLVAISFRPYAPETVEAVRHAVAAGIEVIAITDSPLSPIAEDSLCLQVRDAEVRGFRALSASMCVAQTLAVSLVLNASTRNANGDNPRS